MPYLVEEHSARESKSIKNTKEKLAELDRIVG
jgi:hypothetical protein